MQVYSNSNQDSAKTFLFFLLIVVLAYLPVSSFLFFLKNDAFNGYFPPKFFMSESLHAGQLPLWNPYINFGIPQYGDMSSGYWSPVTWAIASTVGYNAYTLTIELLFYILIGGIGCYQLTGIWVTDKRVRIIAAVAFMCSGYNTGHLQHFNWISGAAFLPWCLWSYQSMHKSFSIRQSLLCAFFFYLLIASAHPGITISAFYFFITLLIFHLSGKWRNNAIKPELQTTGKSHLLFFIALLALGAGLIAGYLDILPHFVRSEKISLASSLSDPTNFQSWISTILPFATVKNDTWYHTDLSVRNAYFGMTLLLFLLLACTRKKNSTQFFYLVTGFLFLLLSTGGIFKTMAYHSIPFIGYVRLNGEFRIFAILCFIIVSSIELHKTMQQERPFSGAAMWIYYLLEIFLFGSILYGAYEAIHLKDSFLYGLSNIISADGLPGKLKALIDAISFSDTLWIQGCIQLLFLWGIKYAMINRNMVLLKNIFIINMIISCLLNIPYTGVGKSSVAEVQAVLKKSPKGLPAPVLRPIWQQDTLSSHEKGLVGDWSLYSKQIGVIHEVPYPVALKNTAVYFDELSRGGTDHFLDHSFVFITPAGKSSRLSINSFSPQRISLAITTDTGNKVILQQNAYPHWFYDNGKEKKQVNRAGTCFMSAPLVKGGNNILFSFEPVLIKRMMLLSLVSMIIVLILIFLSGPRSIFPSWRRR